MILKVNENTKYIQYFTVIVNILEIPLHSTIGTVYPK